MLDRKEGELRQNIQDGANIFNSLDTDLLKSITKFEDMLSLSNGNLLISFMQKEHLVFCWLGPDRTQSNRYTVLNLLRSSVHIEYFTTFFHLRSKTTQGKILCEVPDLGILVNTLNAVVLFDLNGTEIERYPFNVSTPLKQFPIDIFTNVVRFCNAYFVQVKITFNLTYYQEFKCANPLQLQNLFRSLYIDFESNFMKQGKDTFRNNNDIQKIQMKSYFIPFSDEIYIQQANCLIIKDSEHGWISSYSNTDAFFHTALAKFFEFITLCYWDNYTVAFLCDEKQNNYSIKLIDTTHNIHDKKLVKEIKFKAPEYDKKENMHIARQNDQLVMSFPKGIVISLDMQTHLTHTENYSCTPNESIKPIHGNLLLRTSQNKLTLFSPKLHKAAVQAEIKKHISMNSTLYKDLQELVVGYIGDFIVEDIGALMKHHIFNKPTIRSREIPSLDIEQSNKKIKI